MQEDGRKPSLRDAMRGQTQHQNIAIHQVLARYARDAGPAALQACPPFNGGPTRTVCTVFKGLALAPRWRAARGAVSSDVPSVVVRRRRSVRPSVVRPPSVRRRPQEPLASVRRAGADPRRGGQEGKG